MLHQTALFVIVFFVALNLDFLRCKYIKAINDSKALKAAMLNSLIVASSFFIAANYFSNKMIVIPILVGGFIGTFLSVKNNQK